MDRSRAQWWRYELTITGPAGSSVHAETDVHGVLAAASASIGSPVIDNPFTEEAISLLLLGLPIETICVDGTRITVTPVLT
jgi:hypothetical protein